MPTPEETSELILRHTFNEENDTERMKEIADQLRALERLSNIQTGQSIFSNVGMEGAGLNTGVGYTGIFGEKK
jgi:hypothetical protein